MLQGAMPPRFKAVLFDHDGTLVASEELHFAHWQQVLARYGATLTESLYQQLYAGMPSVDNAHDAVKRFGLSVDPAALSEQKNEATRAYLESAAFPLMPDVAVSIARCQAAGLRLGVVTGARGFMAAATLRSHAMAPAFETVVSADDVVHNKPAPDGYLLALQRMGLQAHEAVALEDTEHGVAAATAAGLACVAIPTPMSASHDFRAATIVQPTMVGAVKWLLAQ
jgi:HAD superfamily hydrolase (TIGR01509 family)